MAETAKRKPSTADSLVKAPGTLPTGLRVVGTAGKTPDPTPTLDAKPERNRGGQSGNRNGFRHGLRGTGKLPPELAYLEIRLNGFRRHLEDTVLSVKGEINLADGAAINTALKWEKHGALAQRWLTTGYDNLKPIDRLNFSREVARASTERDKAIAALKLDDKTHQAPWLLAGPTQGDTDNE